MAGPNDPLSIRQLEIFVTLVEHGSFTRTARHLGLSQSTVSGHMADLERRLGVRLVDRERSGVAISREGEVLLPAVREALRAERHARRAAEELLGLLRGRLVVGGSTIPAAYLLPPPLAAFRQAFPDVEIVLKSGDSLEMAEAVRCAEVDIAWIGEARASGAVCAGLHVDTTPGDTLQCAVAPGHPLAEEASVRIQDLQAHAMVRREPGSGTQAAVDDAMEALDAGAAQALPVSCTVGTTDAVKACVRAGLGYAFLSDLAVRDEVRMGVLHVVPIEGLNIGRRFQIVHRPLARMAPAGRLFRERFLP